jgi:hypothetical protein
MEDEDVKRRMQESLGKWKETEPKRDLWPRMIERLEEGERGWHWVDWVLAGGSLIWLMVFPELLPALLYNL